MRQVHRAGEKVFIDYSGDTVAVINPKSGEILTAEIFVATLGASKYAYAEATWTQTLPDWIGSNDPDAGVLRGGAERCGCPDNLKAAIKKACRYEPEATSTYQDCASHYGAAILPARPYHAKDKASVEMSVLGRTALDTRASSQPPVLLAAGAEPGDRRAADGSESPVVQETARQPTHGLRVDRPAGDEATAANPRYEYADWSKAKGRHRLPRRRGSAITTASRTRWWAST